MALRGLRVCDGRELGNGSRQSMMISIPIALSVACIYSINCVPVGSTFRVPPMWRSSTVQHRN
jgi:hypothetical protein